MRDRRIVRLEQSLSFQIQCVSFDIQSTSFENERERKRENERERERERMRERERERERKREREREREREMKYSRCLLPYRVYLLIYPLHLFYIHAIRQMYYIYAI